MHAPRARGRALVVVGLVALLRAVSCGDEPAGAYEAGSRLELRPEALRGERFRLLPGVGPVLARRLEEARVAAGGVLHEGDLAAIQGIGPSLLARWRILWGR